MNSSSSFALARPKREGFTDAGTRVAWTEFDAESGPPSRSDITVTHNTSMYEQCLKEQARIDSEPITGLLQSFRLHRVGGRSRSARAEA